MDNMWVRVIDPIPIAADDLVGWDEGLPIMQAHPGTWLESIAGDFAAQTAASASAASMSASASPEQ